MEKKEIILHTALELLAQKGVHNTPMSAIAKSANVGMGTIYNYFPNKEILINEIYRYIKSGEENVFVSFNLNQPIKTQFEHSFVSIIDFFIENTLFFQFMEQLQASPIITEESKTEGMKSINPILQLLEKGKQERIIKNIETNELIQFIGGAVLSYLRWHLNQKVVPKDAIKNQIKMIWDGIKE